MDQQEIFYSLEKMIAEHRDVAFITVKLPSVFPSILSGLVKKSAQFIDTELIYKFEQSLLFKVPVNVNFLETIDPEPFINLAHEMTFSRFYMDNNIPNKKAYELWATSIKNYCQGRADKIAVVYYNNKPAGMVTINFKEDKSINLHIVGVLNQYQGKGLGKMLMSAITKEYGEYYQIYVETQSLNQNAQRLYKKSGFNLYAIRYILHFWH